MELESENVKLIDDPKVLLFTNAKKGTPFLYKALSFNFQVS